MGFKHSVDTNFTNPLANFSCYRPGATISTTYFACENASNTISDDLPGTSTMPDGIYNCTVQGVNKQSANGYFMLDCGSDAGNIVNALQENEPAASWITTDIQIRVDKGVGNSILMKSSVMNGWFNPLLTFRWAGPL